MLRDPEALRARRRWVGSRILVYGLLLVFAAIYATPALIVLLNSFRTYAEVARHGLIAWPEGFSVEAWVDSWTRTCVSGMCEGIAPNFYNSLKITIPATLFSTAFGVINGYILSKWKFPGSQFIFAMIFLGVFMPPQVSLLPWAWIMGQLHLANSVYGLILIHSIQGISFTTLFCRNFFATVPDELVKAASIDGAGFWRIFWRVMLPLSPPIIIVTVIWQFTSIWNEYLFGMVFTAGYEQPITVALMSAGVGDQSATILIAALPPLIVYFFGGRYFVRGLTQGALK